jgi:dTDP-4-dehydrorhamnose 3,5-epimerase
MAGAAAALAHAPHEHLTSRQQRVSSRRVAGRISAVYGYSMEPLKIDGAWSFTPRIFGDRRGSFLEWFKDAELRADVGHSVQIAQANCSVSRRGVVRGIHFSDVPPGQAKYVTCASGAIIDVVVDVRAGSPGFGSWDAVQLDDETRCALYIGEGLGHAFTALSEQATVLYLCSTPYAPDREHGVNPLDPEVGIIWPADIEPVLSDKDAAAPSLAQAHAAGLLPGYAECQAYVARLRGGSAG